MLCGCVCCVCQNTTGFSFGGMTMQAVKEIHFINYNYSVGSNSTESDITDVMQETWSRVFSKIENILNVLGITPQISSITRNENEMIVYVNYFNLANTLDLLKKLEEVFKVTWLEVDNEYDDWYQTDPHISYGFYEI